MKGKERVGNREGKGMEGEEREGREGVEMIGKGEGDIGMGKESKGDEAERGERVEKMGGLDLDICPGLQRPSVPSHATV